MRNLLVSVDLSEMSGSVVERAACIAQSFVSKLWLLHVAPPPAKSSVPFNLDRDILRAQAARQLRLQRHQLQALADQLRRQRIHVVTRFVSGTVSTTILAEAERIKAELIIMGSHGHGNVYHALFGGVGPEGGVPGDAGAASAHKAALALDAQRVGRKSRSPPAAQLIPGTGRDVMQQALPTCRRTSRASRLPSMV